MTDADLPSTEKSLSDLFGSYRAEWLRDRVFGLFAEPSYFPELQTARPCVLIGGRGTGKTTVLRCLSYEGQFALQRRDASRVAGWRYYGIYYRVNTNRVTAFQGPALAEGDWTRVFAHYLNLELCEGLLHFLSWHVEQCGGATLSSDACASVAISLNLDACQDAQALARAVSLSKLKLEAFINNIGDLPKPALSLQGAPLDLLTSLIAKLPQFSDKLFFFLIDEYENLLDEQQRVANTLIKHATTYTFKIGVRELGWRRRDTLNASEVLVSPADYVRIDISQKLQPHFSDFAKRVCNDRLRLLPTPPELDVDALLGGLGEEEEAALQGVQQIVNDAADGLSDDIRQAFLALPPLEAYFVRWWALGHPEDFATLTQAVSSRLAHVATWTQRYENYRFATLFTIRRLKRGIRKYYCGWQTFVLLAAGNIRYLLELVEQSLLRHLKEGRSFESAVSPRDQTLAAQAIGRKNLSELEGMDVHGARLVKLLLGLGRVFQVMAADQGGHAPEVNQVSLQEDENASINAQALSLVNAAVMHLALLRYPGSKLQDEGETLAFDYTIHPIYAPYFVFSHRKKRKLILPNRQFIELVTAPKATIRDVLRDQGRPNDDDPLPEQLDLFKAFYAG